MLDRTTLRAAWPRASQEVIDNCVASAPAVFSRFEMTARAILVEFMSVLTVESQGGQRLEENLVYTTPARIAAVWPRRFNRVTAAAYIRRPQALANKVYGGRMGNRAGTDDGWAFRGRGGIGITGRGMYETIGRLTGLDLVNEPDLAGRPENFLLIAAAVWSHMDLNRLAMAGNTRAIRLKVNGGLNGYDEVVAAKAKWQKLIAGPPEAAARPAGQLAYGDRGFEVEAIQRRLVALGYAVGRVDGDFGDLTRVAVLAFQADNELTTTGKVDAATRTALAEDRPRPIQAERAEVTAANLREAGSTTIAAADTSKLVGQVAVGGSAVAAIEKTGLLDVAQSSVEQGTALRTTLDAAADLLRWAVDHWWIAGIVGGVLIWYFAGATIAARVRDAARAFNLSR